jgi:glycosyltransferase involved in cell wall biosynthesis
VRARVQSLGLVDRVVMTGPVDHDAVPSHIAALDIALQPRATAYACPMKLLEYMATARAIIAPDQPNIRELVSDRESARLFPPGDHTLLLDLVSQLMSSPRERAALGDHARRTVVERDLTWSANAARALALIRDRVGGAAETVR